MVIVVKNHQNVLFFVSFLSTVVVDSSISLFFFFNFVKECRQVHGASVLEDSYSDTHFGFIPLPL